MKKYYFFLPVVLYAGLIFKISSLPLNDLPDIEIWNFDKIIHIFEYGVLGFLLILAFHSNSSQKTHKYIIFTCIVLGILYGGLDEIHQSFVSNRNSSIYDWIADSIGTACGVYFFLKTKSVIQKILKIS